MRDLLGVGWWKHDPEQAAKLLTEAGFNKSGNGWNCPDGTPFTITIFAPADFEVESQRLAFAVANEWTQFGIPTNVQQKQAGVFFTAENTGAYEVGSYWGSSCGIGPGSVRADGRLAQGLRPPERHADLEQPGPLRNDKLSALIDELRASARPTTPRSSPLGTEILKEIATGLPVIQMFGTSKFVPVNETYWKQLPERRQRLRRPVVVVVELQVHRRPPRAGAGRARTR